MRTRAITHATLALTLGLALAGCTRDTSQGSAPAAPAATTTTQADTAAQVSDARANGHEEGMEMERESHERGMEKAQEAHRAAAAHPPVTGDAVPADPAMPMDHDMPMKDPPKDEPKADPAMPMRDM